MNWLSQRDYVLYTATSTLHISKILLCWTKRQAVHYIMLPTGQIITEDLYSKQLECLQQSLKQEVPAIFNCKCVLLLRDNVSS